jgi:hypothetical protein
MVVHVGRPIVWLTPPSGLLFLPMLSYPPCTATIHRGGGCGGGDCWLAGRCWRRRKGIFSQFYSRFEPEWEHRPAARGTQQLNWPTMFLVKKVALMLHNFFRSLFMKISYVLVWLAARLHCSSTCFTCGRTKDKDDN